MGPPGDRHLAPFGQDRRMMPFGLRQLAHPIRECQGLGEVLELQDALEARDALAFYHPPLRNLWLPRRHLGVRDRRRARAAPRTLLLHQWVHRCSPYLVGTPISCMANYAKMRAAAYPLGLLSGIAVCQSPGPASGSGIRSTTI